MRSFRPSLAAFCAVLFCVPSLSFLAAQTPAVPAPGADLWSVELKRAQDEIRTVRTEFGNQYRRKLAELRAGFQKNADLESALAVREQEKRLEEAEVPLDGKDLVAGPRLLREAQIELLGKQKELLGAVIQKSLPKLVEAKRSLTIGGRLDEASEVLQAIGSLYDGILGPPEKIANGTPVLAEELYLAYQASRKRADQVYKGRQMALRGRAVGIRPDPRDPAAVVLVLYAEVEGGFIDCSFGGNMRLREERQAQGSIFILGRGPSDPAPFRFQKGTGLEVAGKCDGWDEGVRVQECSGCILWKR